MGCPVQEGLIDDDIRARSGVIVGCVLDVPAGQYEVEVFRSDEHDAMSVRLRREFPRVR